MIDSKFGENDLGSTQSGLPSCNNQLPVAAKKIALRDLQNENSIMVPPSTGISSFSKERGPIINQIKVSGTKRPSPEVPVISPRNQCTSSNAANGHLVYVRRKPEAELGKSSTVDSTNSNANYLNLRHLHLSEDAMQLQPQMEEPRISSIPASEPASMASLMSSSCTSSVPVSLGKSGNTISSAQPIKLPLTSALPPLNDHKEMTKMQWEERYLNLQMKLRNMDQSNQEEYLQSMFLNLTKNL